MVSRQLLHKKQSTDALVWCCLQNFTRDFLAEAIFHKSPKNYAKFVSASSVSFNLSNWTSLDYLAEESSFSRHFRQTSTALSSAVHRMASPTYYPKLLNQSPSSYLPYSQLPLARHPNTAAYSTYSGDNSNAGSEISSRSLQSYTLEDLISLINSDKEFKLVTEAEKIIDSILDSQDTELKKSLLQIRTSIYKYLVGSKSSARLRLVTKIIEARNPLLPSKIDFATKLKCVIDLAPQDIEATLNESINQFNSRTVLEFLGTTIRYLRKADNDLGSSSVHSKPRFLIKLYYSIIFKIHGTLQLLDTNSYKLERSLLSEIILSQNRQELVNAIRSLISDDRELVSIFASTAISVAYSIYKFDTVIDLWKVKEEQKTETTYDLFKTMSAYLKLKQSDDALSIYEAHPELHSDWLFDVVLKTYALKMDWSGMQRIFESLFGRGDLPNIKHYRIVMDAISKIANTDIVEMMFNNILSRGLEPTTNIYNAVMFSYYTKGDLEGVLKSFDTLEKSKAVPNNHSYNILVMTFRDTKDLQSALDVIHKVTEKGLSVSRTLLTTIISLCAERCDPLNGERVFNWIYELGNHPDLHCYNALLYCYVESRSRQKAEDLFAEMQRQKIPLRIDTMTIMMKHYIYTKNWDEFHRLLDRRVEMKAEYDEKFYSVMLLYFQERKQVQLATNLVKELASGNQATIFHYTVLMSINFKAKKYEEVVNIYNSLDTLKITPTFQTSAVFLSAMHRLGNQIPKFKEPTFKILNEFLDDKTSIDPTSNFVPRSAIHPSLAKVALQQYASDGEIGNIDEAVAKIKEQAGEKASLNEISVLRKILVIYGQARSWDNFNKYWSSFFAELRKQFVPYNDIQGDERVIINKIPVRFRLDNDKIIRYKIFQMVAFGEHSSIIGLLKQLKSLGFEMSNRLWNETVVLLAGSDESLKDAFKLADKYLMPYELRRSHWKPKLKSKQISPEKYQLMVGQYSIKKATRDALCKSLPRLVNIEAERLNKHRIIYSQDVSPDDALSKLQSEMPEIIPYVYKKSMGMSLTSHKNSEDLQKLSVNNDIDR